MRQHDCWRSVHRLDLNVPSGSSFSAPLACNDRARYKDLWSQHLIFRSADHEPAKILQTSVPLCDGLPVQSTGRRSSDAFGNVCRPHRLAGRRREARSLRACEFTPSSTLTS